MANMYERFGGSDNMEENDDDIGALGSILSWDDEDEAGMQETVAATSSALEDQDTPGHNTLKFKGGTPTYMHQFSGLSDASSNSISNNYAVPMPTPIDFNNAQQQPRTIQSLDQNGRQQAGAPGTQQPQQVMNAGTTTQQQAQNVSTQQQMQQQAQSAVPQVVNSGVNQQQQGVNQGTTFPTQGQQMMQIPNFAMFQQPSIFTPGSQQAMAAFGMAPMMQQAQVPQQQSQEQQHQAQQQQNEFNKVFLQQMQAAAQQFSMQQQSRQMAGQPTAMMPGMRAPQQMQSMAAAAGVLQQQQQATVALAPATHSEKPPKPIKRKATTALPRSEGRPNVVSCSDTDGEMSGMNSASTENKSQRKKAASAPNKKAKTYDEYDDLDDSDAIDTSDMNSEEKAKANRDRNREHARNTRLRKKAYLEKLKTTVDELCRERDSLVSERAGAATLLVEMHNTRTEVLMSFFALRAAGEQRRELWASILDESCFACVMPVTPYRSFPASEVQVSKCQRTILGIDGMMADTASLHVLLNSLIDRLRYPTTKIEFRYTLVTEDAVVAGNQLMARWVMSTVNAVQCGARMEVAKQGMLCCKFNSAHKIIGLELMFDVMAFMLQLKQAAGSDAFSVVPNTVQTCQRSFDVPMVMTLAERPYTIVQVNKLWEDMTGFKAEDIVGKASCRVLQGQETDHRTLESLMNAVRFKRPASGLLVNYTRTGKRFRNYLTFYPLSTDSKVTHYVALTTHLDVIDVPGSNATPNPQVVASESSRQGSKSQPLEGQAQLMSQSMVLPGARTTLGNASMQAGAPTMPPLGYFSPQAIMSSAMGKMLPPISEPATAASVTASTSSGSSHSSVKDGGTISNVST